MIRHAKAAIQYASDRLREPSTQAGLAGVALLVAHNAGNDTVTAACTTIGTVCGLAAIVMPDDNGGP